MDEPKILFSDEAPTDLLELERYVSEQDGPQRADLVLGRIAGTIRTLAFMPGMGRPRPYLNHGTRVFPSLPWLVVYTLLATLDGIRIIRIVDGRRDLPKVLGSRGRKSR